MAMQMKDIGSLHLSELLHKDSSKRQTFREPTMDILKERVQEPTNLLLQTFITIISVKNLCYIIFKDQNISDTILINYNPYHPITAKNVNIFFRNPAVFLSK